jgi:magnesium-transporting ATPase (P-type)
MIVGYSVVRKAVLGIKHRQLFDESFLMALATVGAFVTGENAEAVAVMLFYQVGEWFQSYAVGRSRKSISDLMDIAPEYANLVKEDGEVEVVDPYDVEVGNTLLIKPGERIPVDGVVLSGTSMINTSALTGESVPSEKQEEKLCPKCKSVYIPYDEDYCDNCRTSRAYDIEPDSDMDMENDEKWRDFLDEDEKEEISNSGEDEEELISLSKIQEEEQNEFAEEEEEEDFYSEEDSEDDDDFSYDNVDFDENLEDEEEEEEDYEEEDF